MIKTHRVLLFMLAIVLISCGGDDTVYDEKEEIAPVPTADYDELSQELDELEATLTANPQDIETRKKAVTRFQDFANFFPDDPKAADCLFKASDHAREADQAAKASKILKRIQNEYPAYDKMIDVDYNYASLLDWELRDTSGAKAAYQSFMEKYPNDNRTADAAIRIKYIRYGWDEYTEMVFNGQIEPVVQ